MKTSLYLSGMVMGPLLVHGMYLPPQRTLSRLSFLAGSSCTTCRIGGAARSCWGSFRRARVSASASHSSAGAGQPLPHLPLHVKQQKKEENLMKPLSSENPYVSTSFSLEHDAVLSEDTIFALSSGVSSNQATALAVFRISGPKALEILRQFTPHARTLPRPRQASLRTLIDPQTQQALDQALVLYFPAPHSFTGEEVVEWHCHGSRAVVQALLRAVPATGLARLAEPGEFTQRAWTHGKMDLLQVEALADLLTADTDAQRQQALRQLEGSLSKLYESWRQQLIAGLAHAEAVIDFGDDERLGDMDHDDLDGDSVSYSKGSSPKKTTNTLDEDDDTQQWTIWGNVLENMQQLRISMEKQLMDERRGEIIRQGLQVAIVGPPNAGKSSLFNWLAQRDAAIVSPQAGTTRDVLEVTLSLGGVKCILQDTAGVRTATTDEIEWEGIRRAIRTASGADLVIAMVDTMQVDTGLQIVDSLLQTPPSGDGSSATSTRIDDEQENETGFHRGIKPKNVLLVLNKSDLRNSTTINDPEFFHVTTLLGRIGGVHEISCVTQSGLEAFLEDLTSRVVDRVSSGSEGSQQMKDSSAYQLPKDPPQEFAQPKDSWTENALITRARHRQHVQAAVEALERFDLLGRSGSLAVDLAAEELRLATSELGRITGAVDVEDVLDKLFADFCIGK